jgi:hypothetical protein
LNSAKLGKDLNKLLDAQTQLDRKVIKEVEKQLAKRKAKLKKLGGLQKAIDESRAMVQKLIGQLIDMNKLLESHEAFTVQVEASIVALKAKKPGWATVAEKIVWLSSIVASPTIMTIASDAENLEKLAGLIEKSFEALKDEAANRV